MNSIKTVWWNQMQLYLDVELGLRGAGRYKRRSYRPASSCDRTSYQWNASVARRRWRRRRHFSRRSRLQHSNGSPIWGPWRSSASNCGSRPQSCPAPSHRIGCVPKPPASASRRFRRRRTKSTPKKLQLTLSQCVNFLNWNFTNENLSLKTYF